MTAPAAAGPATLAEVMHCRAASTDGDATAYTFLADGATDAQSITWAQLDRRAGELATVLRDRGAAGQPVLLALPSGLAFVESLFACWYAGAIAVPVSLPRHPRSRGRLDRIIADAGARFAIGTADTRQRLGADLAAITWVDAEATGRASGPDPVGVQTAVLQYTSGSTGTPRGVVVTHANLMHNSGQIAAACGHGPGTTIAGWLPLFHDMGLVGLVLQAAFSGARCVLMPPERFLMRPWLWLRMLSDHGARSSPAPNFAYDLCVDKVGPEHRASLDLSRWRNALNGSEPVRAATLDRFATAFAGCGFRRDAFFPCYGLAEATLLVTGPAAPAPPRVVRGHVGCGRPFGDARVAIIDPQSARPVDDGAVGEVWVASDSCAAGYWNDPTSTAETFHGRLAGDDQHWLRTGDLGFLSDGELFVTGRLRELIIIAGRNHFPVDLERTTEAADPAIARSGVAAVSVDVDGAERLAIVAEVCREHRGATGLDTDGIRRRVRAAVAAEHEVTPHDVALIRPGTLPRTTSGKVAHHLARAAYLGRTLERIDVPAHVTT
jgi:acyl-CoA synthetase (AMP-forming)/AMP-acid ligase II